MLISRLLSPSTLALACFISLSLIGLTGCDAIKDATEDARTRNVDVSLGAAGQNIPLASGDTAKTDQVSGASGLPDGAVTVNSITLDEEDASFNPLLNGSAPGDGVSSSRVLADGTVEVYLIVERVPVIGATVTVQDDQVTAIDPSPISVGDGLGGFAGCLSEIDGGEDLVRSDYESADPGDVLSGALQQSNFTLGVAVCSDGLNGTLSIEEATMEVEVGG